MKNSKNYKVLQYGVIAFVGLTLSGCLSFGSDSKVVQQDVPPKKSVIKETTKMFDVATNEPRNSKQIATSTGLINEAKNASKDAIKQSTAQKKSMELSINEAEVSTAVNETSGVDTLNNQKGSDIDLTSVFDPLYKILIVKEDLSEVSGQQIAVIQKTLNSLGYAVGNADGKAGKNTVAGITSFLEDFELPLDNPRPTGLLIKQLNAVNDRSSGTSIIDIIKAVQKGLQNIGYKVGKSGLADSITRQAILDYQLKEGLIVDGRITNQLLTALKVK